MAEVTAPRGTIAWRHLFAVASLPALLVIPVTVLPDTRAAQVFGDDYWARAGLAFRLGPWIALLAVPPALLLTLAALYRFGGRTVLTPVSRVAKVLGAAFLGGAVCGPLLLFLLLLPLADPSWDSLLGHIIEGLTLLLLGLSYPVLGLCFLHGLLALAVPEALQGGRLTLTFVLISAPCSVVLGALLGLPPASEWVGLEAAIGHTPGEGGPGLFLLIGGTYFCLGASLGAIAAARRLAGERRPS